MIDRFLSYSCAKAKAVVPPMLGLALPRRFATDFLGVGSRPEVDEWFWGRQLDAKNSYSNCTLGFSFATFAFRLAVVLCLETDSGCLTTLTTRQLLPWL